MQDLGRFGASARGVKSGKPVKPEELPPNNGLATYGDELLPLPLSSITSPALSFIGGLEDGHQAVEDDDENDEKELPLRCDTDKQLPATRALSGPGSTGSPGEPTILLPGGETSFLMPSCHLTPAAGGNGTPTKDDGGLS